MLTRVTLALALAAGPALADLRFSGTVAAETPVELRAAREGMTVAEVLVRSGDRVAAGALLARLRSDEQRAALNAAQAALARAEAAAVAAGTDIRVAQSELRIARAQAERSDALGATLSREIAEQRAEGRARAEAVLDRAEAAHAVARADIATARAGVETATLHLADTEIRTPVAGLVLTRRAEVGAAAADLFVIAKDGAMVVKAQVLAPDLRRLSPGLAASVRLDGTEVEGRIDGIDGSIDPATRLGTVRIAIPPAATAGAFASGSIHLGDIRESHLQ